MKREIIQTEDGSTTIFLPEWGESYHSKFGAIQEANHVFIKNGLSLFNTNSLSILEIGLGTGLNVFITYLEAQKNSKEINYVGVEAFPVPKDESKLLNYVAELNASKEAKIFDLIHDSDWEKEIALTENFTLLKRKQFFNDINDENAFDLIYFDAFGYPSQPELWSVEIFTKMYNALKQDGILVTYACRSVIKRAMQSSGFLVEKLAGPPGKREMLRAYKKV